MVQLVEALRYQLGGRGFELLRCHSGRTMAPGSTQPLKETNTRNIFWGGGLRRPVRRPDNLPPSCADCLEIWESQPSGTLRAFTCVFYGPSKRVSWLTSACSPNTAMLVASAGSWLCAVNEQATCRPTSLLCLLPVCGATAGLSGYLLLCYSSILSEWPYQLLRKSLTCVSLLLIIVRSSAVRDTQEGEKHSELRHKMRRWAGRLNWDTVRWATRKTERQIASWQ